MTPRTIRSDSGRSTTAGGEETLALVDLCSLFEDVGGGRR